MVILPVPMPGMRYETQHPITSPTLSNFLWMVRYLLGKQEE